MPLMDSMRGKKSQIKSNRQMIKLYLVYSCVKHYTDTKRIDLNTNLLFHSPVLMLVRVTCYDTETIRQRLSSHMQMP